VLILNEIKKITMVVTMSNYTLLLSSDKNNALTHTTEFYFLIKYYKKRH